MTHKCDKSKKVILKTPLFVVLNFNPLYKSSDVTRPIHTQFFYDTVFTSSGAWKKEYYFIPSNEKIETYNLYNITLYSAKLQFASATAVRSIIVPYITICNTEWYNCYLNKDDIMVR